MLLSSAMVQAVVDVTEWSAGKTFSFAHLLTILSFFCFLLLIPKPLLVADLTLVCHMEKAEYAQQHPGTKTTINPAEDNRKKQCKPDKTNPNPITISPRKRYNIPTHR